MIPRGPDSRDAFEVEVVRGTTHLVMRQPILEVPVLEELRSVFRTLAESAVRLPLVLRSSHPTVFLAGADLSDIADLDSSSCVPYARRGREVIRLLDRYPAPTVAAVSGSCSGGGFDLVMACDAIVAGPSATFRHPGISRGLVTGWSGTTRLPDLVGKTPARSLLLEGSSLDAATARAVGLVHTIDTDAVAQATRFALDLGALDPSRRQLWRALRGPVFVDRFRASVVHKL